MHPRIFQEFQSVLGERVGERFSGRVLEVGAVPDPSTLLLSPPLRDAERVGINLEGPSEFDGCKIVGGNANDMPQFPDESFDLVLCNATLEHDPRFWLTVSEIHRVLKPGGAAIIGVPGYTSTTRRATRAARRAVIRAVGTFPQLDWLAKGTLTFKVHNAPGDYYRFSPQAVEEVFLRDMRDVTVTPVMQPPRLIGSGVKPGRNGTSA